MTVSLYREATSLKSRAASDLGADATVADRLPSTVAMSIVVASDPDARDDSGRAEYVPPATQTLPIARVDALTTAVQRRVIPQARVERAVIETPLNLQSQRPQLLQSQRRQRAPAPVALRAAVVALFVLLLATIGGELLIRAHPNAVHWLGHELSSQPSAAAASRTSSARGHFGPTGSGFSYAVPANSYSIAVQISHPCWVIVKQLRTGATDFAATLQPTSEPEQIRVTGSVSIEVAARANSIKFLVGSHAVGVIPQPVVGTPYLIAAR